MKRAFFVGKSRSIPALIAGMLISTGIAAAQPDQAARGKPAAQKERAAKGRPAAQAEKAAPRAGRKAAATAGKRTARPSLKEAGLLLNMPGRKKVQEGLRQMKEIGGPSIIAPVSARLRQGLPPTLVVLAVEALVKTGSQRATPALIELYGHRRASIRKAAVSALGELKARRALPVLRDALDDGEGEVRAAAVEALRRIGDRRALGELYRAFERGESTALSAIAGMAGPKDVNRLVGYLDQNPMNTLRPVYLELLRRKDFPVKGKLDLVARLGAMEHPDAEKFLRKVPEELPRAQGAPVMRAIGKALLKIRTARLEESKEEGAGKKAEVTGKKGESAGKKSDPAGKKGESAVKKGAVTGKEGE